MISFIENLKDRADKAARYNQVLSELNQLSAREAADMGFSKYDYPRIAREAVYGK